MLPKSFLLVALLLGVTLLHSGIVRGDDEDADEFDEEEEEGNTKRNRILKLQYKN